MNYLPVFRPFYAENVADIVRKMAEGNFSVGESLLVEITHINHPQSFFARLYTLRYAVKFLETPGSELELSELEVGMLVVYTSISAKKDIRGRIQKIDQCERGLGLICSIFAIDYGYVDNHVLPTEIFRPLNLEECSSCGPLAIHCQLYACEPLRDEFDEDTIEVMKFFVGTPPAKIKILYKTMDQLKVELLTMECNNSVSTVLCLLRYTNSYLKNDKKIVAKTHVPRFTHRQLQAGDKLHVQVLSVSSTYEFYAAVMEEYDYYNEGVKGLWYQFSKYCKRQPRANVSNAISLKYACAVKVNDQRYERAIVRNITVPNAKAMVVLVDSGQEIEANFEDIRKVGGEYSKCPPMAIFCYADKLHRLSVSPILPTVNPGVQFIAQVTFAGDGFRLPHHVNLFPC